MIENNSKKQRIIQEYVPGKQVTLAHIIARPDKSMLQKIGLNDYGDKAIGIMTITPSEAVMIATDLAVKSSDVKIGFIDRFNGSIIIIGLVADVEEAIKEAISFLEFAMGFSIVSITRS